MYVAIVTETYPPEINGVALTVRSLEEGLSELGHRVAIVRPRRGDRQAPRQDELLVPGMGLPRYPGLHMGLPATRRLVRHWGTDRPDAIYVATEGPLGASAVAAARRLGIPATTGYHTRFDDYLADYGIGALAPLARRWLRHVHNRAGATLVPTRALVEELTGRGFRTVLRLARAVDTRRFDPAHRDPALRAAWGAAPDTPVVIHVGRIAAEKNLQLAVRAFRALQEDRPDARFVLVGDGPARAALERANPDFVFCGIQRDMALARHFASGDVFLFPSTTETFGNVTLEAMASGVATVAFDYGAAREHIRNGISGRTIALGDEIDFVRAACMLGTEPALRARLAAAGRQAVAELEPRAVSARFAQILADLRTHPPQADLQGIEVPR
ncbi:glycosyltransferase family 4 protein [Coralloluteibacterium thermophilus]|uniref:Glycosyltransferase family 4 protein n=1 Tax=Coralloluteibacterium thermophilum TaxID=2707049 RepID=A0ABV9NIG1_9GAMM